MTCVSLIGAVRSAKPLDSHRFFLFFHMPGVCMHLSGASPYPPCLISSSSPFQQPSNDSGNFLKSVSSLQRKPALPACGIKGHQHNDGDRGSRT